MTENPKIIQVIESYITRGSGDKPNTSRRVRQYFTIDGEFLAEHDPITDVHDGSYIRNAHIEC